MKSLRSVLLIATLLALLFLTACGGRIAEPSPPADAILFTAERTNLQAGECTILQWSVTEGFGVMLNGELVDKAGQVEVCPQGTTLLTLEVDLGTRIETRQVEITVGGAGPEAGPGPVTPGVPAYQSGAAWIRLGGPPGGLGYDIRMTPDSPDVMYVTDAFAGFHKSTDGGQSWFPINQGIEPSLGVGTTAFCLTIDPHDYNSLWGGLQLSGHIYHSSDAGQTWEQRDNGLLFEDCIRSVRGITVDPNDQSTIYAGIEADYGCWSDQPRIGRQAVVRGEVYKSTDGGASWSRIWLGDNMARYIWVDPRNSNRIYVSTGLFDRDAANSDIPNGIWGGVGILRSDDGGQTWTVLDQDNGLGGLYIPSLFMHPEDPDTLLAAVTYPADPGGEGAYVTHDGGDTWQRILPREQNMGMDAVEISISDPDVWYAAAENVIYRSDDAGLTWSGPMSMKTLDGRDGGLPIDLQVDPRDPYRIFQNAYGGGNMASTDGGATWADASSGYTGMRVHTLFVLPGTSGRTVFADGFRSDDGGVTWRPIGVAAGGYLGYSDEAGYHLVAAAGGSAQLSDDGGFTWEEVQVAGPLDQPYSMAFAQAPSDPQTHYLAYFHWNCPLLKHFFGPCSEPMPGAFRSRDGGRTWEKITDPAHGLSVLSLAVHPNDPQTVYAGTVDGLYLTRDGGANWQSVVSFNQTSMAIPLTDADTFVGFTNAVVYDIAFDPFDSRIIYGSGKPAPFLLSTDGGSTWRVSAAGMDPNEPTADILPDPNHQGIIYVASRLSGVFVSADGGQTWRQIVVGLERKDVMVLALSDDSSVLYAGTASGNGGAGVWRLGTP